MKTGLPQWAEGDAEGHHLVVIGGGHTHVQLLKHLAMRSDEATWSKPALRVTVIVDHPIAIYSGMVPGFVAGQYQSEELEIDVVPLAQLAGASVIVAKALGVDPATKSVRVEGRAAIRYDLLSVDIGSTVAGLELPGVKEHSLASRPISHLVKQVATLTDNSLPEVENPLELVVVGAGAGGIELAFTLRERLSRQTGTPPAVTVIHAGDVILPGSPSSLVGKVKRAAQRRNIEIRTETRVERIDANGQRKRIRTAGGESIDCDLVVWVAGAAPHQAFDPGTLSTNESGFLSTEPTLLVEGSDDVFAVGDCATLNATPTPKAGVYAVRQGPVLIDNIERWLEGAELRPYKPQRDFLTLLNLGDGTAIGSKWGVAFEGQWVMSLKDRIDRAFMTKFQVLRGTAQLSDTFAPLVEAMQSDQEGPMPCGGCAAKLEQGALAGALARLAAASEDSATPHPNTLLGLDQPDDVAAWRTPGGDIVVQSVDAFRAFTDDPWLVGRVAAENALSDLFAKGAAASRALAIIGLPLDLSPTVAEELLFQVLSGARSCLDTQRVELIGGHTTLSQELWVGFSVDGLAPAVDPTASTHHAAILRAATPNAGDRLILTKPLGTGVLLHAHMLSQLDGRHYANLVAALTSSNRHAGALAREHQASASTDITGFGLIGHLLEMLSGRATLGATLDLPAIPALEGARLCLQRGLRSTAHPANAQRMNQVTNNGHPVENVDLLFDPQTSGGLLISIAAERAEALCAALVEGGDQRAAIIGSVVELPSDAQDDLKRIQLTSESNTST